MSSIYLIWRVDAFPNLPEYAPLPMISGSVSALQKFFTQGSFDRLLAGFTICRQLVLSQRSCSAFFLHEDSELQTLGKGEFST